MNAAARRALVTAGALALAVGAAELFLRQRSTLIVSRGSAFLEHDADLLVRFTPKGKRLVPNAHVVIRNHFLSRKDVFMDVNSLGFRDAELPRPKGPNELRILVLGDSITWGDYLQANEVYVERAERHLREALPQKTVQVVNGGVGDIGLREELDILEEQGLAISPDVVVAAFYLNDSRPPWGFPAEVGHPGWLRRHSVLADTLYRAFKLKRWMRRQGEERFQWVRAFRKMDWKNDPAVFHRLVTMAKYDWGAAWDEGSWAVIRDGLVRLRGLSQARGFKVALVAFPVSFQVYAKFLDDSPQQRLRKEAAEMGFAFLDLLPLLRSHAEEDLFFDQCHPREHANELIGAELASFLATAFEWR